MKLDVSFVTVREHTAGIVAQVAASLPLLLVTVWIAHSGSLEGAGRFTVVVGVSAVAYSTALWGLRTGVVIDQFRHFTPSEYLHARGASLLIAGAVTAVGGLWMEVGAVLLLVIIMLRSADALADLGLAFAQLRFGTDRALRLLAFAHLGKLTLVCAPLGLAVFFRIERVGVGLLSAAVLAFLGVCFAGWRADLLDGGPTTEKSVGMKQILAVFGRSKWFALAVVSCAVLTSTPRIVVPVLYLGDQLGAVGVSLSVSTFFGMVFFTAWLRNLPRFEAAERQTTVLRSFLIEWLVIGVLLYVVSRTVLPPIVAKVFNFPDPSLTEVSSSVLAASVAFAAGMSLANLYKLTPWAWMESVAYVLPILLLGAATQIFSWPRTMPTLLVIAGGSLLLVSAPAIRKTAGMHTRDQAHGKRIWRRGDLHSDGQSAHPSSPAYDEGRS